MISTRRLALTLMLAGWIPTLFAQTNPPVTAREELQRRLLEHVVRPQFEAGSFGVKIISLDTGITIFEHQAGRLFSPASNCKLFTVALALDQLGGDYRIKTSLHAAARPSRSGTLKGNLIIYGRGDPCINERLHSNDIFQALEPLVAALTNAGVRRITGDLVGDESYFRGPPCGSGWTCDDLQFHYGAEISALTINDNLLTLTVQPGDCIGASCKLSLTPASGYLTLSNRTRMTSAGGRHELQWHRPLGENVIFVSGEWPWNDLPHQEFLTVHQPAGLFLALFKEALARHGIKVGGKLRTLNWLDHQVEPGKRIELGSVESLPLRELVREINMSSQNLYADLLLAHLGALAGTAAPGSKTSEEAGIEKLNSFLGRAGVGHGEVQFEEGSGLSRNNLATPNAIVALLKFMSRHAEAAAYRESLPIAGVDGTLKERMVNTAAAGKVRAKTGTLRWANSLSGYVTTAAGEHLAFAIMLNRQVPDPKTSTDNEMDFIPVLLAEFAGRSDR